MERSLTELAERVLIHVEDGCACKNKSLTELLNFILKKEERAEYAINDPDASWNLPK